MSYDFKFKGPINWIRSHSNGEGFQWYDGIYVDKEFGYLGIYAQCENDLKILRMDYYYKGYNYVKQLSDFTYSPRGIMWKAKKWVRELITQLGDL